MASNANPPNQLPVWLQHMNNVASLANQAGASMAAPATRPAPHNSNQNILPNHIYPNGHGLQAFPGTDILPVPGSITQMQHRFMLNDDGSESKEKRERRLARNRESARQSRRRKKDLLLNLQGQVSNLHGEIENARQGKLETMEHELVADRIRILNEIFLDQSYNGQSASSVDRLVRAVRSGGPNTAERNAGVRFQYNELQKLFLPFYRQIFVSLSLKDRRFFTDAKEVRIRVSFSELYEQLLIV